MWFREAKENPQGGGGLPVEDRARRGRVGIRVDSVGAELRYDASRLDLSVDTVALPDPRLSRVWGKQIYRLSFKAKRLETKGRYSFSISRR